MPVFFFHLRASTLLCNTDIHTEVKPSHLNLISCGGRWCSCNGGSGLEQSHGGLGLQRQTETGGNQTNIFTTSAFPLQATVGLLVASTTQCTASLMTQLTHCALTQWSVECCYLLWHGSCVILNFEI